MSEMTMDFDGVRELTLEEMEDVAGGPIALLPGVIGGVGGAIIGGGSYIANHAFNGGGSGASAGGFLSATLGGAAAGAIGAYGGWAIAGGGAVAVLSAGASGAFDAAAN